MGGGYVFEDIGGLVIWVCKGFKGSYRESKDSKYSYLVGFLFVFMVIYIISIIYDDPMF
ncbi:MAG: hypothetical protein HRT66_12630 [Flavobacteriaceae bacterium]|nr:hypothetical protein [Flavobacteriaceae bacterium]